MFLLNSKYGLSFLVSSKKENNLTYKFSIKVGGYMHVLWRKIKYSLNSKSLEQRSVKMPTEGAMPN